MNLRLGKLTMNDIDAEAQRKSERAAAAQKRVKDGIEVTPDDWVRIFGMKNSKRDNERLLRVKNAMDDDRIQRNPADAFNAKGNPKAFSKAEAMRLFATLAEMERGQTLLDMVENTPENYELVLDYTRLREIINEITAAPISQPIIAVDTETTGVDVYSDVIVGMSITNPDTDRHYYIPVKPTKDSRALDAESVFDIVRPMMEDENIRKVYHNAIFDINMFERHGIRAKGLYWDTMTAMALLNENEPSYALKNLATKYLKEPSDTYEELFGKNAPFADVPLDAALVYGAKDTDITFRLYEYQLHHLRKMPTILEYLLDTEIPLLEVVRQMERTGYTIDVEYAREYAVEMKRDIDRMEAKLIAELDYAKPNPNVIETGDRVEWYDNDNNAMLADVISTTSNTITVSAAPGEQPYPTEQGLITLSRNAAIIREKREHVPINLNSPAQLKAALTIHTGQTFESTDAKKVLKPMSKEYPVIKRLLDYREMSKLYGTYISTLPEKIHPATGKLHGSFFPNGTVTGRFSSRNPNMQNLPDDARSIFVAPPGYVIAGADFSSQEIRCAANRSGEPILIEAFEQGLDPYALLASKYFDKPYSECYKTEDDKDTQERLTMKLVMLAVMYGMGAGALSGALKVSSAEAKRFLDEFFETYGHIDAWVKSAQAFAKRYGYVWMGDRLRKRRLPDARRKVFGYVPEVARALRQAPNGEIQGESAIQTKKTLVALAPVAAERGWKIWATIHDEILVLMPKSFTQEDIDIFESVMVNTYQFGDIPNATDIEIMTTWGNGVTPEVWFSRQGA